MITISSAVPYISKKKKKKQYKQFPQHRKKSQEKEREREREEDSVRKGRKNRWKREGEGEGKKRRESVKETEKEKEEEEEEEKIEKAVLKKFFFKVHRLLRMHSLARLRHRTGLGNNITPKKGKIGKNTTPTSRGPVESNADPESPVGSLAKTTKP